MAGQVPKILITEESPGPSPVQSVVPSPRATPRGGNRTKTSPAPWGKPGSSSATPRGETSALGRPGQGIKSKPPGTPRPAAISNGQGIEKFKVRSSVVQTSRESSSRVRREEFQEPRRRSQTAKFLRPTFTTAAPPPPPPPPPEPPRRERTVHLSYRSPCASPSPSRASSASSHATPGPLTAWGPRDACHGSKTDSKTTGLADAKTKSRSKRKRNEKNKNRAKVELNLEDLTIEDMLRYEMDQREDDEDDDDEDDDSTIDSDAESRGSTIDTDLDLGFEEDKEAYRKNIYARACALLHVIPSQSFMRQMGLAQLDLRNAQLSTEDFKAICISLLSNITVTRLNLSGNDLGVKGAEYLAEMLHENVYITSLKVARCNLNEAAVAVLLECLRNNFSVKALDLSGNPLPGTQIHPVASYIKRNDTLLALRLSDNHVDEIGGQILGPAIAANSSLKRLNLSWNHLRLKGAQAVCGALLENTVLEVMDLSWNGLGQEGGHALELPLLRNKTLVELNLTSNRLDIHCLRPVLSAVTRNSTLEVLKLGHNPLTTESAKSILATLETSTKTGLRELDLSDVVIDDEFVHLVKRMQQSCTLRVTYGDILHKPTFELGRALPVNSIDPLYVLFEYMRQRNYRLIDLFRDLDTDNSNTLSKREIADLFRQLQLPVSDGLIDELMKKVDLDKNNEIDIEEMKIAQRKNARRLLAKRAKLLKANKARESRPSLQLPPGSPGRSEEGSSRSTSPLGQFPGFRRKETLHSPSRRSMHESLDDSMIPTIPLLKKPVPRLKSAR